MSQSSDSFGPWINSLGWVWDVATLTAELATQASGGGGGDASAANQTTEIARLTSLLAQFDVALSTRLKPADTLTGVTTVATVTTVGAVTAISNALPAGTNAIGKLAANSGVDIGDVDVTSEVSSSFDHGSNRDVDTSAEQITATSIAANFGVVVKAADGNTGKVYVGNSDVTADTTDATDGIELSAGQSVLVKVNNANKVYVIASANNQKVFWLLA